MNINLIIPHIPAVLDRHIPCSAKTAGHILLNLASKIESSLILFAKHTPFKSVSILTDPIEVLMRKLAPQSQKPESSANLNIILQLGASVQDGRWHHASGFTVTSQPSNPQSDQFSDLLIHQATQLLGQAAIASPTTAICQREHSAARLLDIAAAPTVLATNLYIDNPHDACILGSSSGINLLAAVYSEALEQYREINQ